MIALFLCVALADESVVEELSGGRVDWTRGVLTVEASATPNPLNGGSFKTTEQDARLKLVATLKGLAREIPVDARRNCGDLLAEDTPSARALEEGLQEGRGHWRVVETQYRSSGKVEVIAELSLVEWIRPALVGVGFGDTEPAANPGASTGLLVDARGLPVQPVFAPRLLAPNGDILYDAESLSASRSVGRSPVIWIQDPVASGLSERVGRQPLIVVVDRVERGGDLVLSGRDAARVRAIAAGADLLSAAPVAILVDGG